MADDRICIRYEQLPEGGLSVWVQTQSRYQHTPGDTYANTWVCVWSTAGGNPGRHLPPTACAEFVAKTHPGPDIPLSQLKDAAP